MSREKQLFIIIFFFLTSEFINPLKWFKILLSNARLLSALNMELLALKTKNVHTIQDSF